jgi:Polysaccharide deacetylase
MKRAIPVLVTHDLELAPDHDWDGQQRALESLSNDLASLGVATTMFATATAAERFAPEVVSLLERSHEIGFHGVSHGADENFRGADERRATQLVGEGTSRLEAATGRVPRCFRGPFSSTSSGTQRALVAKGYCSDFSVGSARLDYLSTRGGTHRWLNAPRVPYRPSASSPYRRGDVRLWVVPLSGLGVPFLSGAMYLFGLTFMKRYFDALRAEAARTGGPIVYLFHSYEFAPRARARENGNAVPSKGWHRLYRQDRRRRYDDTLRLIEHMRRADGVECVTGSDFIRRWCPTD